MQHTTLNITLVQPDIFWEDKAANLEQYTKLIGSIEDKMEVVVLPEMFSTGFSMQPERLAEKMDGATVAWMIDTAKNRRCILTGSLIIEENGNYYNRLLWVQPDGQIAYYDKRHLFGYANEDKHYTKGNKKLIVSVKGFKICLLICYDLRFPAWARNRNSDYDVLIYVANWPERRNLAWKTLLQARAIENISYVVGVNRVGEDGNQIKYSGDSSVFGPLGELIWQNTNSITAHTVTIEKKVIEDTRNQFPFLNDADSFMILDN